MLNQRIYSLKTKIFSEEDHRRVSRLREEIVARFTEFSLITIFVFACILAPENTTAQDIEIKSFKRTDYISQEDIQAQGGYMLKVGKGGVVRLINARSERYPNKACLIDRKTLQPLLLKAIQGSASSAIEVEIKFVNCPSGTPPNTVCCSGAGAGCKLDVIVVQRPSS